MMRLILYTIVAVAVVGTATTFVSTANAVEDDPQSGSGHETATAVEPIDLVGRRLPTAVLKTYQALFPRHRVWQSLRYGEGKQAKYELIIFDPNSPVVHTQRVGPASVSTLLNSKLILSITGELIYEEQHVIADDAVPKAARVAFDKWKRQFPQRFLMLEWRAHQAEGAERLYSVRVVLNAVETYGATLKADGTFVKKYTDFEKDRSSTPDE
jgi:hypothetical protein